MSTVSIIVISTVIFSEFPEGSVPSRIASYTPTVVNISGDKVKVSIEQLSKLPLSTSIAKTVTEGLPSRFTVISCPIIVG